jgi:hypothetical protein
VVYIECIQGIPLLILLFIVYFGLSVYGLSLPSLVAAGLAMMIYVSAYLGDIWRGCIEAMPKPQWEAAECLAFSRWQTLRLVIIPQAMRLSLPPTVGFLVQIIKMTSLASVIGFVELTRPARSSTTPSSSPSWFSSWSALSISPVLSAVALERSDGEQTQCRQSPSPGRSQAGFASPSLSTRSGKPGGHSQAGPRLQELRLQPGPEGRFLRGRQGRDDRHHRRQRLGQEHGAALHRPARGDRQGHHRGLRHPRRQPRRRPEAAAPKWASCSRATTCSPTSRCRRTSCWRCAT